MSLPRLIQSVDLAMELNMTAKKQKRVLLIMHILLTGPILAACCAVLYYLIWPV